MGTSDGQRWSLPADLARRVEEAAAEWDRGDGTERLWRRDARLWTGGDESRWLGWLAVAERERPLATDLARFAAEVRDQDFRDALLLGMGGSSLGPEVLAAICVARPGFPRLRVLDSTDPGQIRAFEDRLEPEGTLVIVSSKSGTTLETDLLRRHFWRRLGKAGGDPGRRFVAITDPGSRLEEVARAHGYRWVFRGDPEVGGRFSVLTPFGMAPAAAGGLDPARLLAGAREMAGRCAPSAPAEGNPGVRLGLLLAVAAAAGRDKVTLLASPALAPFGAWLEQLLAESTGKEGKGLIPVDREQAGPPEVYGDDRLFVSLRLLAEAEDPAIARLEEAGQPLARLVLGERTELGAEFFRWEVATAVAGAVLGVHPFDQPDVEASKVATRALTDRYEAEGALPEEIAIAREGSLTLFADESYAAGLGAAGVGEHLRAHLERLRPGDYFALLTYLEASPEHDRELQEIRHLVRDRTRVATCLGYGPRFLHSTGQAYKGGPDTGVFLQLTRDDEADVEVTGRRYTFGVVKAAQARGDFAVLAERRRRLLRVHLGADARRGLEELRALVDSALP